MSFIDFLSGTPDIIKELSKYVPTPNMSILRLTHSKLRNLVTVYECSIDTLMAYAAFNSFDNILELTQMWGFTPMLSTKCAALLGGNSRLADKILLPGLELPLELAVKKCNFPFMHSPCRSTGPHLNSYPIEATIVELSVFSRYLLDSRLYPRILFSKNSFMEKLSRFINKLPVTVVVYCIETLIGRQTPLQWLYMDYNESFSIIIYALAQLHRIIGLLVHSEKAIKQYLHTEREYNNILSSFYLLAFLGESNVIEENEYDIKCRIVDNHDIVLPRFFTNLHSPFEYICQDIISYNILAGASLGGHIELVRDRLPMVRDDDFSNIVLENTACGENNKQTIKIFQYAKTLPATNFAKVAYILIVLDREDIVTILKKDGLINDDVLKNIYSQVIGFYPHCKRYVRPLGRMGVTDMRLQLFSAAGSGDYETVQELLDAGTIYLDQEDYESAQRRWPHLILWSKQDVDYALQWSIQRDHFACVPVLKHAGAGSNPDEILENVLNGGVIRNSANFSTIHMVLWYLSNEKYSRSKLFIKALTKTIKHNITSMDLRTVLKLPLTIAVMCILLSLSAVKGVVVLSMWGFRTVCTQWYNLRRRVYF